MKLSFEFEHLRAVAKGAMDRGNPQPARTLFKSYKAEAELLKRTSRDDDYQMARRKAQMIGSILAQDDGEGQPDPASPYAAEKLKQIHDPVDRMKLTPHQIWAAREIARMYEAMVRGLFVRVRPTDGIQVDTSVKDRSPFSMMPLALAHKRAGQFLPWTQAHLGQQIGDMGLVDLVLAVVVDRTPISVLSKRLKKRKSNVGKAFRRTLNAYGEGCH